MTGEVLPPNPEDHPPVVDLPLADRIQLAHALIEYVSLTAGIDLLHIKGHAANDGLYAPGRISTDVDVLVRPSHADRLLERLTREGWEIVTTFQSGSIFHHAATLWNDQWGHVDVHRAFPGVGLDPSAFFDLLWAARSEKIIAGRLCRVPAPLHQSFLIVLHAARDPYRGVDDVRFVRTVLGPEAWAELERVAATFGAHVSFAAATGRLSEWNAHPDHDVWDVVSRGGTRVELYLARWRASQTCAARWELVRTFLTVNRDHLRMRLLREPRPLDYVREVGLRVTDVMRSLGFGWRTRSRRS